MKPAKILTLTLAIIILVLIAYFRVFNYDFISWDDTAYTIGNTSVASLSFSNLKEWFTSFFIGNYHPLTMASFAIDRALGGSNPAVYHATNVALHAFNAVLVWHFIRALGADQTTAFATAVIWALHPSSVESTAWIAERKTLLSGTFYLSGLTIYAINHHRLTRNHTITILGLGAAAMLSKATAVAFPLSLLAIDIWKGQGKLLSARLLVKLPLFLLAFIIGLIAVKAQQHGGFLNRNVPEYPLFKVLYAGHAYSSYIIRILAPINLSVIYPYPTDVLIPALYCLLAAAVIAAGFIAQKSHWNVFSGGIAFFTVNICFLLQFINFGEALSADRYMYVASIGIIYPCIHYLFSVLKDKKRPIAIAISSLFATTLLIMTSIRARAWRSDLSFFTALSETFPNSAVAHSSLGATYLQKGDLSLAEFHLDKATILDPENYKAWHNKGNLYMKTGRTMEAFEAFSKSIEINGHTKSYFARAVIHQETGRYKLAIADIQKVLSHPPTDARAWYLFGYCSEKTEKYADAILAYSQAIGISGENPLFYARRGVAQTMTGNYPAAIADLRKATNMPDPKPDYFYFLGNALFASAQNPCPDWENAARAGYPDALVAIQKHCR